MDRGDNSQFYSRLPVNEIPLADLFSEAHLFAAIPQDWHVVLTDVKNSTAAIAKGLHESINLVATGSIVAVLNLAFKETITVPFFFGGDGATFIIPPALLDPVLEALTRHRENTAENFELDLRVGHVPVAEIYKYNHSLSVAKFRSSPVFTIPVLLGTGLVYAENKIKGADVSLPVRPAMGNDLDLSGMQCRWDKVKPPENSSEVVSLLVCATAAGSQAQAFRKVMTAIDEIYGGLQTRQPIAVDRLKVTLARMGIEMKARGLGFRPWYLITNWTKLLLGYLYFKTRQGKKYLFSLVQMADTLVIDGRINTVISGTSAQREKLRQALHQIEQDGQIIFGICVSTESVMSCYVRNIKDRHIHFVDGAEGGYTRAANMLKQKI